MNENKKSVTGFRGPSVRSDCYFELEICESGGLKIEIKSKVSSMYGDKIRALIEEMCRYFNIENGSVYLEDAGALPFTIAARFECAYQRIFPDNSQEFLLPLGVNYSYETTLHRLRRSRLYLPGNEPKFFPNAGLHKPDAIILDLEDSVSPKEKDAARFIVRNALRSVNFYGAERMVRINQLPMGLQDLKYVIPHNANLILIPKVESKEQIIAIDIEVKKLARIYNVSHNIFYMPIIESAAGVINSYSIATSSEKVCALAIGLEDYTADLGTERTKEGKESFYARSTVINAAKAAGVQAIDTVFSDVSDMEGLLESVKEAKMMGFEGKGCIHPRQIPVVHNGFAPTPPEIEKAQKIVKAFEVAKASGLGVVSLGSKMIDAPVVKRAENVIELALLNNLIFLDWRNS